MLPPAARLRRRAEFAATTRGGRRAGRGAVVVHLARSTGPAGAEHPAAGTTPASPAVSRAGFAVSRAVGNAVVRNRVRRRLRHLVRERLATLPAGCTLVIRALPAAADRSFEQLGRDLDTALDAVLAPRGSGRRSRRSATGAARVPGPTRAPSPPAEPRPVIPGEA